MEKPRIHFDDWCREMRRDKPSDVSDYSLKDYIRLWDYELGMNVESGPPDHHQMIFMAANMHAYAVHGCQCFNMGKRLIEMFTRTSLKNVKAEHIRLPYSGFYISLPEGTISMWGGSRTKEHDICGIYVRKAYYFEDKIDISFSMIGLPNERSVNYFDDTAAWCGLAFRQIEEAGNLDLLLDQQLQGPAGWLPDGIVEGSPLHEKQLRNLKLAARISINLCLYLSTNKADCELDERSARERQRRSVIEARLNKKSGATQRHNLARKATRLTCARVYYVGESIENAEPRRSVDGHWVRAHLHSYRVGPGRCSIEIKWIDEFEKTGNKDTEIKSLKSRLYEVTE